MAKQAQSLRLEWVEAGTLTANPDNWRRHPKGQITALQAVIEDPAVGWTGALLFNEKTGRLIDGHARRKIVDESAVVPGLIGSWSEEAERKILATLDPLAAMAEADAEALKGLLETVDLSGEALAGLEMELAAALEGSRTFGGGDGDRSAATQSLAEQFGVPPFSVLDTRQGYWQERKRAWISLGIQSEQGRDRDLGRGGRQPTMGHVTQGTSKEIREVFLGAGYSASIFDPVLCELAYRWFCPPSGVVLDPYAGGSVRGIVAARLGRRYVGIDLRSEQVAANEDQAGRIAPDNPPRWIAGDSRRLSELWTEAIDFIFTCPPYFDLERYSDDECDLSNAASYEAFLDDYRAIASQAVALLKDDRFASIVVGEIRDKRGIYRNFVGDTVRAFQDAGVKFYNEAILVTSVGSLRVRVGKQFRAGRKLGKAHQNVLVFVKGDPKKATAACGPVELDETVEVA